MKQKNNAGKKPVIIKVDKTLDQYLTKGLFKEKPNQSKSCSQDNQAS